MGITRHAFLALSDSRLAKALAKSLGQAGYSITLCVPEFDALVMVSQTETRLDVAIIELTGNQANRRNMVSLFTRRMPPTPVIGLKPKDPKNNFYQDSQLTQEEQELVILRIRPKVWETAEAVMKSVREAMQRKPRQGPS